MGGKFDYVTQSNNDTLRVNNTVAFVNGTTWQALGSGVVGEVHRIRTDKCNNAYFGGTFSVAGGVETGPIAKWDPLLKKWGKISDSQIFWFGESSVNDFQITNCNDNCVCDFWIVGKFTAQVPNSDTFAYNVIRWDSSKARWDTLDGATRLISVGEVFTVYKKDSNANPYTDYVWIAGNFVGLFSKFEISTRRWGLSYQPDGVFKSITGTIYDMRYQSEQYYEMDKIYFVGDFVVGSSSCTNQCQFNIKTEEFVTIGSVNTMPTAIFTASWGNSSLYAGGNVLNSSFLIKKIRLPTIGGTWISVVSNSFPYPAVVKTIDICDRLECVVGAFTVGGSPGVLRYFNGTGWDNFATGVPGDIRSVVSISNFAVKLKLSFLGVIMLIQVFIL
jgi:hypothetical protein